MDILEGKYTGYDINKEALAEYFEGAITTLEIVQADIQSMIGTSTCPYVTGILETQNIDAVDKRSDLLKETKEEVNHPMHYKSDSGMEVIDVIKAFTSGLDGCEATHTGNIIKYACRWKKKGGIKDLKKLQWYVTDLINELEKKGEKK